MRRTTMRLTATALLTALTLSARVPGQAAAPATTDPFAQATVAAKNAAAVPDANPFRPQVDGTRPDRTADAPTGDAQQARRAIGDQALLDARRALSVGDLRRAQQYLGQVEQLKLVYQGPGDSPQGIADSIREYQELAEIRETSGNAGPWRPMYAKFLVKQADALLGWNDLATATRAANEAAQLNPQFPIGGVTPQDVLRRINLKRQEQAAVAAADQKPVAVGAPAGITPAANAKAHTLALLAQSRAALATGDLATAEALAGQASSLNVPESQFAPNDDRPSRLATDLLRARGEVSTIQLTDSQPTAGAMPQTATPGAADYAQAVSAPAGNDGLAMRIAQLPTDAAPLPLPAAGDAPASEGRELLEAGEQALRSGDRAAALDAFRLAYEHRAELDVLSQQRLQGHLQMLSAGSRSESLPSPDGNLLDAASAGHSVLVRQLQADVTKQQSDAEKLRESDPNESLVLLREARRMVQEAEVEKNIRDQLLSRIDMSAAGVEKYMHDHKAELELNATNNKILTEIDRERAVKVELQQRIAEDLNKFNALIDEQRYAEAEVVANRMFEMAPDDLIAQQVNHQAKMIRRERWNREIIAEAEDGNSKTLMGVHALAADAAKNSNTIFGFGDHWGDKAGRLSSSELTGGQRSPKELEIEQKLKTPVLPRYDETPLTKVVEGLSQLAGVNIHLDPRGLEQENVRSDTKITLNLPQEISLKSALTLILEPLHLTYTINDEVLKITSVQIRDGDMKVKAYSVGDLVIPIPNFVPTNNIGLQGLINDAYAAMGAYGNGGAAGAMAVVAGHQPGQVAGPLSKNIAAQQFGAQGGGNPSSLGSGPGGLGGAASADFDSLIDLIISTVEHDSWMENGTGEGDIQPFPTNLSLVISQTQRVHEQIADLLSQLRKLQDLQVTIEVRFIRLTDSFFERIGIDFDFNIEDGSNLPRNPGDPDALTPGSIFEPRRASATVGIQTPPTLGSFPNYTVDLDLPFRQESFGLTEPQFGAPTDVATFGFAILSDIEAFFLIEASQGDRRANVLQAPKVTLFNGQQAMVVDAAFRPFVISVIPVVGEFAAAQQPVIVVLSEGTMLTVQAVVSEDRRYVRLTLVPFFSQIGQVQEFTFEGSETSSTSSSDSSTDDGDDESNEETEEITRSGTTVQLPTFEVISVSTTVSVPDGGTVLLGGIKRLVEGRNEFGVPLLSKIPYVDRLFRNVGIGRETDSLMMMVTPHIIIQEEEEERLGIAAE